MKNLAPGTKISFSVHHYIQGECIESYGSITDVDNMQKLWKCLNGHFHNWHCEHGVPDFSLHFRILDGKITCRGDFRIIDGELICSPSSDSFDLDRGKKL
jgi:hypothetical protein